MADSSSVALRGETPPWRRAEWIFLFLLIAVAFAFRVYKLSAEGFADDEIHKWLAANRYLHLQFGGDDVEHPMVMKDLIAVSILLFRHWMAPEALTRLPNVLAGAVSVGVLAQLGKRLFGKGAALIAATVYALSAMCVGYGRIAKEDTLYTLFLMAFFLCIAEAMAAAEDGRERDQARWEIRGAIAIGVTFACKYQVFFLPFLIPMYFWLRRGGSKWQLSIKRLLQLAVVGIAVMLALDWALLMPSTWVYFSHYLSGHQNAGDRATSESILFLGKLYDNLGLHILHSPPLAFFFVFADVKLAPPTVALMAIGMGMALWQRRLEQRFLLAWIGMFLVVYFVMGVKYARYFIPLFPPMILMAGDAGAKLIERLTRTRPGLAGGALAVLGLLVAIPEAAATITHLPHPRLYINSLAGGDARVDYYFPHCDYFDAGLREATLAIAAKAEPDAEISAEPSWVVAYYAKTAGRPDITTTMIRSGIACVHHHVCYVIVQTGRLYWHNEAALDRLAKRAPWTKVDVGGHHVIRVYRLGPDEALFPPAGSAVAGNH